MTRSAPVASARMIALSGPVGGFLYAMGAATFSQLPRFGQLCSKGRSRPKPAKSTIQLLGWPGPRVVKTRMIVASRSRGSWHLPEPPGISLFLMSIRVSAYPVVT